MKTDADFADYADFKHTEITRRVIKAALEVHNTLGYGFAERVYENALAVEFKAAGLRFVQQPPVKVFYKRQLVGDYVADFIVDDKVIVELKAVRVMDKAHEVQLVNYLKATHVEVGLLLNFGRSLEMKRKAFSSRMQIEPKAPKKSAKSAESASKQN